MVAEIGEYKGNKVLKLSKGENDKYPFAFGLNKAKLILENIIAIQEFVEAESKDKETEPEY